MHQIVDGTRRRGSGEQIDLVDPSTGEVLDVVDLASPC